LKIEILSRFFKSLRFDLVISLKVPYIIIMKKLIFKLFCAIFLPGLCWNMQVNALEFTVIGPCSATPLLQVQSPYSEGNLGDLTVSLLTKYQLSFRGDRSGIASISNSPVGDTAIEILPDHSFRSYGWCVSVDNNQPPITPNNVRIDSSVQTVKWFYAYTRNSNGNWSEYCTPAYLAHSLSVCR
jgi:hypothetical protein